jgi:predicted N-formylglutamate amidohydrolase
MLPAKSSSHSACVTLRPHGQGRFVFFCDHASHCVPAELKNLGLPESELARHIAWDIGAAGVTEELSDIFDSPAILCGTSRLVIDCNRHLDAHDLIPEVSDGTSIPGNRDLTHAERQLRVEEWFEPYHAAIESVIEGRQAPSIAVSIHSMTDCLAESVRPWQIALSSHLDRMLVEPMLIALKRPGDILVGDNQPYDLDPSVDYTIPFHALRRNMLHLQVEFRQDEISGEAGQLSWARRFAAALAELSAPGAVTPSRKGGDSANLRSRLGNAMQTEP